MQNNRKINCNNTIQKEIFISKLILVSRYMFLYKSEINTNLIQDIRYDIQKKLIYMKFRIE